MPTLAELVAQGQRERELGIVPESRTPVAHCQVGNHPIFADPASSSPKNYTVRDGKEICFRHEIRLQEDATENALERDSGLGGNRHHARGGCRGFEFDEGDAPGS